ncbi:MAG: zinc ribbon domain-containing protein [Candidatus Promineifilaceae bacterium]
MSQLDHLLRLQQIDDNLRQAKRRLTEVGRLLQGDPALAAARQRQAEAAAERQRWRTAHNDLNLEVNSLVAKAEREETRLYSGLVKNPKELTDLQREIESLRRRRGRLEDDLLEAMVNLETAEAAAAAATAELAATESGWQTAEADLTQEQVALAGRLRDLSARRAQEVGQLTAQSLTAYDQAVRRGGGLGVARLVDGRCQGCQMTVPSNLAREAATGRLARCDSCGRILSP